MHSEFRHRPSLFPRLRSRATFPNFFLYINIFFRSAFKVGKMLKLFRRSLIYNRVYGRFDSFRDRLSTALLWYHFSSFQFCLLRRRPCDEKLSRKSTRYQSRKNIQNISADEKKGSLWRFFLIRNMNRVGNRWPKYFNLIKWKWFP